MTAFGGWGRGEAGRRDAQGQGTDDRRQQELSVCSGLRASTVQAAHTHTQGSGLEVAAACTECGAISGAISGWWQCGTIIGSPQLQWSP